MKARSSRTVRAIVWERDDGARSLVEAFGRENGWDVRTARSHAELETELASGTDIVLVEHPNLYFTTDESLLSFASEHPAIAVVALIGASGSGRIARLLDDGVSDCLVKPLDGRALEESSRRALAHAAIRIREMRQRQKLVRRALHGIGIELPVNGRDRTRLRPRLWVILAAAILAVLGSGFGFLEYSTSPRFCNSCHIMKPFVKAWKESTHSEIGCVECHYPPDEYWRTKFQAVSQVAAWLTGTYSTKPYAEIDDANCLSCHTTRLLEGGVVFERGIKFDHTPHLGQLRRGKKLRCTTCHSQIVQGEHVAVNERVCFICHFMGRVQGIEPQSQEFCTECHLPPEGDIQLAGLTYNHEDFVGNGVECQRCHLEAVQGDGSVAKHTCYTCHGEPERIARIGEDSFMHTTHVTKHKVECDQCHSEIVHNVTTQTAPLEYDCRTCHSSMHEGIKKMYMGTGGRGVDDAPSPMYLAQVDCIGCHVESAPPPDEVVGFGEKTLVAVEKGCTACHGDDYEGILGMWLASIDEDLAATSKVMDAARAALAGTEGTDRAKKAHDLLDEANLNYHFVKTFHGAHNPDYAASLLEKARRDAAQALEILGVQP